jgi:hypothetical protein
MPVRKFGGRHVTEEWIACKDLDPNPAYQRPEREPRIRQIVNEFDPDAINVLLISRRDGKNYVIDGKQRRAAVVRIMGDEQKVPCHVYHDLTEAQEAALFNKIDDDKSSLLPIEIFKAEIIEGDKTVLSIVEILDRYNIEVAMSSKAAKVVRFPKTLKDVFRLAGPEVFEQTIATLTKASYGVDEPMQDQFFRGLAMLIKRYGSTLDFTRLVRRIEGVQVGITQQAKIFRANSGSTWGNDTLICRLLFDRYNSGLRNKLPWVERAPRNSWLPVRPDEIANTL